MFHISKLKKANEDPERPLEVSQPGPIHEFGDGSTYYIAEEIVGKKTVRGRVMYKVKWKDWPAWENSWQTLTDLKNVPELIEAYEKAHATVRGRRPRRNSN